MNNIILGDLLFKINQNLPILTYINTDNNSFPEEFRFSYINCYRLICLINQNNKELLLRSIKYVNEDENLAYSIINNNINHDEYDFILELRIELM